MHGTNHFSNDNPGVGTIDADREYFSIVLDRFFHPSVICAYPGGTCQRIEDTIRHLEQDLGREEKLMARTGFPGITAHKKEHRKLLNNLNQLKRTLVCGRYDNALVADYLTEWMKSHATDFDKPFGKFLKEQGIDISQREGF